MGIQQLIEWEDLVRVVNNMTDEQKQMFMKFMSNQLGRVIDEKEFDMYLSALNNHVYYSPARQHGRTRTVLQSTSDAIDWSGMRVDKKSKKVAVAETRCMARTRMEDILKEKEELLAGKKVDVMIDDPSVWSKTLDRLYEDVFNTLGIARERL